MHGDDSSGNGLVLGIDVGSVTVGMVLMTSGKEVVGHDYRLHHGNISDTVLDVLKEIDMDRVCAVAATDQTSALVDADFRLDDRVAVITAARHFHKNPGTVLHVGGEKFSMLFFDENGNYTGLKSNTSCAAGTGSFLDQQAYRLNLAGIEALAEMAVKNTGERPGIASRCAVFAKTDLVHAQQEGYGLPEICDGLCHGLAKNIANTVFTDKPPHMPVVFCGGVAKNKAVVDHISSILGTRPIVDEMAHLYGAFGAAAGMIDRGCLPAGPLPEKRRQVMFPIDSRRKYGHPPLTITLSHYPRFDSKARSVFIPSRKEVNSPVEVDLYENLQPGKRYSVYIGLDIGSTSTKGVWVSPEKYVLAGFYTRTAGRPVAATQNLLAAMANLARSHMIDLDIKGAGTTGSGRKFVGALAGADLVIDEITAHARAAIELEPGVDTIIEIGGQDSKFTTLRNGRVTFSIMNTVCAAGTGSFLEEQAEKLGVPLSEYADRTHAKRAPIASDRCTVFMERDINYYLGCGYSVDEVLTAALHGVRENYLNKVAVESAIGNTICFQGATARNRSLVAAFEQRLKKPINVSPYCHLTGALGVALELSDSNVENSRFRGLALHKTDIPVRFEVCGVCTNSCRITVADMMDGPVAYGFLCGRDYDTPHFIDNNRSGFDLVRTYRDLFPHKSAVSGRSGVTVGIPAALYMFEDAAMWIAFFNRLGIRTTTGAKAGKDLLENGKSLAGAEFCAPVTAMYGGMAYLAEKTDFIFLPYYLENREKSGSGRRQYCYYSQYAPSLVAGMGPDVADKMVSPVINFLYSNFQRRLELYRAVRKIDGNCNFVEVVRAFEQAREDRRAAYKKWREIYYSHASEAGDISVMLLGRPYTVLDPVMNKNIPRIFATLGVKTFFQDMLDTETGEMSSINPFLEELHWNYAAGVMKAAEMVSRTPGIYPVLMSSFNCSPDSFIRDIFQELMESSGKPYLILEMDEHGSGVGYETRIEAAVRAFGNHATIRKPAPKRPHRVNPVRTPSMAGKTLVLPNWDPLTCRLLVATLKREGVDTRLMREDEGTIRRSMRLNSGQCIPINAMAQEFVEYVRENDINPGKTVLWVPHAEIACNIRLYPYRLKQMIESFGGGMEKAGVYAGKAGFTDVSFKSGINSYFAFMFGGMLRKMGCRIRPYEKKPGETNRAIATSIRILEDAFLNGANKESAVKKTVEMFSRIETTAESRPQIAIFGDLYVRDNPVFNQDLIEFIEQYGGEVITTPYTDYVKMIASTYFRKWFTEGRYMSLVVNRALFKAVAFQEKTYSRHFRNVLKAPEPVYDDPPATILERFNVIPEHTGESMDNLLKIHYIKKHHPDISLFVQVSPSFCCPSMVTEAMAGTVEARTGVPVVSITYDGTGGEKNRKIIPYLEFTMGFGGETGKAVGVD